MSVIDFHCISSWQKVQLIPTIIHAVKGKCKICSSLAFAMANERCKVARIARYGRVPMA